HGRRRARGSHRRGLARHAGRAGRRGVRGGRDRGPRAHAPSARGRPRGRPHARARDPLLRRARDARDLPRGDRDPHRAARGPLRESGRMRSAVVVWALAVLAAIPKLASPYYVTLVLPALAYGIALLGFNLLFGYT